MKMIPRDEGSNCDSLEIPSALPSMPVNWSKQTRQLKSWLQICNAATPGFGIDEIRRNFDLSVHHANQEITAFSEFIIVFVPTDWAPEDDWLLTGDQWAYMAAAL